MKKLFLLAVLLLAPHYVGAQGVPDFGRDVPNGPTGSWQIAPIFTVATLPSCVASLVGAWSAVSDATTPTYNAALVGGGAVQVPVYCNGVAWTSH